MTLDQWRQQQKQAQADLMLSDLRMKQLKDQIATSEREAKQPHLMGTTTNPMGDTIAMFQDPMSGKLSVKIIAPSSFNRDSLIAALPSKVQSLAQYLDNKSLQTLAESVAKDDITTPKTKPINYRTDALGYPTEITDQSGVTWMPNDPALSPELKSIVAQVRADADKNRDLKSNEDARKTADAISRAMQIGDYRELQKERGKVFDLAKRALAGHSFLKTIQAQVESAERTGGTGTTAGDMLITESFMQLMFGVDPRALRGSPKMMEIMMRQGGVDDRTIALYNSLVSGGRLSQDVRNDMLEKAGEQVQSWDQSVNMTGQLTDDVKTKDLVNRYNSTIGSNAFTAGASGSNTDFRDLGGKKVPEPKKP
jgi:hypothetical protein